MSTDKTPTQRVNEAKINCGFQAVPLPMQLLAYELAAELERAKAELAEWRLLQIWGGTPEHVDKWIKGQQVRIHAAQDVEKDLESMQAENAALREDKAMMDWLADRNNAIGEVCLPEEFVAPHLDDMRAAIRAAMKQTEGK